MRLAVIGAGNIGATIGRSWITAGHEVHFGVSAPAKYDGLAALGAVVTTVAAATAGVNAVLLAVPGSVVQNVLSEMGPAWHQTTVMDATNNVSGSGPLNAHTAVTEAAPSALYYRAFNSLGWENFADPGFPGGERADLFYAGPEGESRQMVERLVQDVGLRPVWVGGTEHIDTVDGVARLWFALVMGRHLSRRTAFRMLTH
jgi:predicted dinucleotide-binding enzyme